VRLPLLQAARGSFFLRLYLSYALLVVTVAAIIGLLVLGTLRRSALQDIEDNLFGAARLIAAMEAANPDHLWSSRLQAQVAEVAREADLRLTLLLASGRILADSHEPPSMPTASIQDADTLDLPEIAAARSHGRGAATRPAAPGAAEMLFLAVPILLEYETIGYVRVGMPLERLSARREELGARVLAGASVNALIALAVGLLFARSVTRPLARIAEVCRRFAGGDFEARVALRRPDEIGLVASTVDRMAEAVQGHLASEKRERERLATLLSAMADGVVAVSARGTIAYANDVAAGLLAFDRARAAAAPVDEILRPCAIRRLYAEARDTRQPRRAEVRLKAHPDDRVLAVSATPLTDANDARFGVLLVLHDLSELRRLEEVRRTFTANVSHELKTPLTAIDAMVSTLLDDADMPAADRRHFLTRIADQSERLQELVRDLLVIARLESAQQVLEIESVELAPVVASSLGTFEPIAKAKGIELAGPAPAPTLTIRGNAEALRLIVGNLLHNAIRYTPKGGRVHVELRRAGDTAAILVHDTGIGIAPEHMERIFERFYRVDPARDRAAGGTGLGLAIVKHLTHAQGGQVLVESTPGTGSLFAVQFPLA